MNLCIIKGRLGNDPVIRSFGESGISVEFNVAVDRFVSKEKGKVTDWISIKVYGKRSVFVNDHFGKGDEILVHGRFQTDNWEKDGVKHSRSFIVADDVEFCGGKRGPAGTTMQTPHFDDSEEIPF